VLFADPGAPARVREELLDQVVRAGFESPDDVRGVAHLGVVNLAN
jgi:hypothetical protein